MDKAMELLWGIASLIRKQFWPFLLFWLAILLMRFYKLGGLWTLAFINAEWAVQFWANHYSYATAFIICSLCANIDLAIWFWFFKRGRYVLTNLYPEAGHWLVAKFDPIQYQSAKHDHWLPAIVKGLVAKLITTFGRTRHFGLLLMGFTPFCGIVIGVPTAVAYRVKYGYWVMALGNTLKIVVFGSVFSSRPFLAVLILALALFLLKKNNPH